MRAFLFALLFTKSELQICLALQTLSRLSVMSLTERACLTSQTLTLHRANWYSPATVA